MTLQNNISQAQLKKSPGYCKRLFLGWQGSFYLWARFCKIENIGRFLALSTSNPKDRISKHHVAK
jgi:hypothetical protein